MMGERTRTRRAPEGRITGRVLSEARALHLCLDVHVEGRFLRFFSRLLCTGTAALFEKFPFILSPVHRTIRIGEI